MTGFIMFCTPFSIKNVDVPCKNFLDIMVKKLLYEVHINHKSKAQSFLLISQSKS